MPKVCNIYNKSCYGLSDVADNSVDAVITDPPYGINLEEWDKIPDKKIWEDCFRVLKPGGFLLSFSSIKFQHVFTNHLLEAGFEFKDVLLWTYLNGRVPPIDLDKKIDSHLGLEREVIGEYNYVQGTPNSKKKDSYTAKNKKTAPTEQSKAWAGFGTGLKTAYEPIIMVQKPLEKDLAHNILKYGVGALNLEATRIPYEDGEGKVGHNPHPVGRVMSNIIQVEEFGDYQKFFFVGKVRDGKKTGNIHPTSKPVQLMNCLISLCTVDNQTVLDPFMGSGSTGVSSLINNRNFIGYEKGKEYFDIASKRIKDKK
jgi:site-specific DNA-methyltransferase (adenine-specific)